MENTLITQDRLDSIVKLCHQTKAKVIAEVGVYKGGSLKYLAENFPDAHIFGYDTFEGLPGKYWNDDEIHQPGDFNDTSFEQVRKFINKKNVYLIKGIFPESVQDWHNPVEFDFIHIDTDFYESVKQSLDWFWPRLSNGGIIVFDDLDWENCPGVRRALEEFNEPIYQDVKYQGYLIKT